MVFLYIILFSFYNILIGSRGGWTAHGSYLILLSEEIKVQKSLTFGLDHIPSKTLGWNTDLFLGFLNTSFPF